MKLTGKGTVMIENIAKNINTQGQFCSKREIYGLLARKTIGVKGLCFNQD